MGVEPLKLNGGMPRCLLLTIAVMAALTVANLHYNVPVLDLISRDLGVAQVDANLITVLTQGGYAAGILFVVPLGDFFDARRIILFNFLLLVLSLLFFAFSGCIGQLWVCSVVTGLGSVAVQMYIPLVSAYSEPEKKSLHVGYVVSSLLLGVLLGRVVGGLVGGAVGWRMLYICAAVLMAGSYVVCLLSFPRMKPTFRGTYSGLLRSLWTLLRQYPQILSGSMLSALAFASFQVLWACMAFHVSGYPFNAGSSVVGMLGLCGFVAAAAVMGIGRYVDRYGVKNFSRVGLCVMAMAWLILLVYGNSYAGLIVGIVLVDVGQQFVGVSMQSHILVIDSKAAGRLNTIYMTALFIGASAGTFLAGQAWRIYGWRGVCVTGIVLALSAFVTLVLRNNGASKGTKSSPAV